MTIPNFLSKLCGAAFCTLCLSAVAAAQGSPPPGSTGPTPPSQAPTGVPIDGGASLLLAAGGAYALKRLRNRRARV